MKKRRWGWLACVVALVGSVFLLSLPAVAATAPSQKVSPEVYRALATQPKVRVVIMLREPTAAYEDLPGREAEIEAVRNRVRSKQATGDLAPSNQWEALSGLAGEVTLRGVETLAADPDVLRVDLDVTLQGGLAESVPLIHGDVVHNTLGFTGLGVTVAVLDTGVDSRHPDLSTDIAAEACFCKTALGAGCCPTGALTLTGPGSAMDDNGHGTHVTGIITSDGLIAAPGLAPKAQIVSVKVLDQHNSAASLAQVLDGLNWVILNRSALNIKVVNMSLGTGTLYTGVCDTADTATGLFAQAITTLKSAGVTVFAASMNGGSSTQMAAPACVGSAVAVGAVYDANIGSSASLTTQYACTDLTTAPNQVACFSNSDSVLALLAPGAAITSTTLSTTGTTFGTATLAGTSQAAPFAAGAAAVLLQVNPALTPDQIAATLKATGVPVTDPRNGLTFPRIDLQAAVQAVLPSVISVSKAGAGSGTVTSTPAGIACGTTCSASFTAGTAVSLTAAPVPGFAFTGWSGACTGTAACTINLTTTQSVTATFQDATPPVVVHTPVTSAAVNTAIPILASITDNLGVQGATLFYRATGAPAYTAVALTAAGATYSATIPGSAVTRAGVQYYLEARDAAGNVQRVPSTAPGAPYGVVVGITVFTDEPLLAQSTPIKALHFSELQAAINRLRTRFSLAAFTWSGPAPAPGGTVSAAPLNDLRLALTQTYASAGRLAPAYTDPSLTAGLTVIKASHLSELRTYVRALE